MITTNIADIWPEWKIEKKIGEGAFGVVYKAVRQEHNVTSYAAIKVISIPKTSSELNSLRSEGLNMNATRTYLHNIVNNFVNEIQLMESFKGIQNIVSIEDYKVVEKKGEIGWDIYIRMELLTSFNDYLCDKKMTEQEVIKLGCDICTALEICGKRNIIHRDIKPENIFINDFGSFKLGDFGIARKMENFTVALSKKGTYNYMAPEIYNNEEYDERVDIYSLGIVLYRLMNGNRLPFLSEEQLLNPDEKRRALERRIHGEKLPVPCDASTEMASLILTACAYNPNERFSSASAMKKALMSLKQDKSDGLGVTENLKRDNKTMIVHKAPQTPQHQKNSKKKENTFGKKKSKLPSAIAAILVIVLLIGGGYFAYPHLINILSNESTEKEKDRIKNPSITIDGFDREEESKEDEEQEEIKLILEEADKLADSDDLEGAINKIQTALLTYPESTNLQNKLNEYTEAFDLQRKQQILNEAAALADKEDYLAAMAVIEAGQKEAPEDKDYQSAYENYESLYQEGIVNDALESADELAASGDYLGALQTINTAIKKVEEDETLRVLAEEYEAAYVKSISAQVDQYLQQQDVVTAKEVLEVAAEEVPDNEAIKERIQEVNEYKTVSLSTLTTINGGFKWNEGSPEDPFGTDYTGVANYVVQHRGTSSDSATIMSEYKIDQAYTELSFQVSPYKDFSSSANSYIQIYVDDALRYVSPVITQKSGVIKVSGLDISDATYLKIVFHIGVKGCLLFSDVLLTSSPTFESQLTDEFTSLSTLPLFNGNIEWDNGLPQDIFDNDYTTVKNYAVLHHNTSSDSSFTAEYYLAGNYTSISFDIAPYSDFTSSSSAYVKVYVDDVLQYTSSAITQKTERFSTGEIDVSNANYVKIVVEFDGTHTCLILSDAVLRNK